MAFGLILPEVTADEECVFELWWDAQLAWEVFMDVASPWKFSMDRIVGIDDAALIAVIKLHPIKKSAQLEVLRDAQAAAREALKHIYEQREKLHAK